MNIIFAGTPQFSVATLEALIASEHRVCAVYTQPDRQAGRGRKIKFSEVKQCALGHDIPLEQPLNFNSADALATLSDYQADLLVVVAYGIILPLSVLNAPRFGCINIHASLLPRWRGAAPIQRAILSGDEKTGITLMQMDEGLDTGDMLAKVDYTILPEDSSSSLHDKLSILGAAALIELLPAVEQQQLQAVAQTEDEVSYAHKLSKQEARIDWNKPAAEVLRAIQGYNPWPVAHTSLNDATLRIWAARSDQDSSVETAGQIKTEKNRLFVACADQYIEITELQAANKRRMSASDYLSAHKIDKLQLD
ncbi:methionyl-tRNA formyltransferase [Cycloclasticus sp. 46_120_T64]|nr:methionyl-tRNA formyltransferase [Cycloclasticus sp. 46_120_T64]